DEAEGPPGTGAFLEVRGGLDRQIPLPGQRLDGLHAADVGTGEDLVDRLLLEGFGQGVGLTPAGFGQRPLAVVALPCVAIPRLGMTDHVDRDARPPVNPSLRGRVRGAGRGHGDSW